MWSDQILWLLGGPGLVVSTCRAEFCLIPASSPLDGFTKGQEKHTEHQRKPQPAVSGYYHMLVMENKNSKHCTLKPFSERKQVTVNGEILKYDNWEWVRSPWHFFKNLSWRETLRVAFKFLSASASLQTGNFLPVHLSTHLKATLGKPSLQWEARIHRQGYWPEI